MQYCIRSLISITNVQTCCKRAKVCVSLLLWHFKTIWIENICLPFIEVHCSNQQQERQGRWCIFDTGWSHWIDYLVKEDMMKVAWPGSNQIILVSGLKIVAKSQSELWRLITNSSAKFKADPVSGVYAKGYHMIGTNSANSAGDDHQ